MSGSNVWDGEELYVYIGRMATMKEFRGRRFGKVLVEAAVDFAGRNPGEVVVRDDAEAGDQAEDQTSWKGLICAHAQTEALGFYQKMGFEVDEGMGHWWEEGIEHVGIWKRVDVGREEV